MNFDLGPLGVLYSWQSCVVAFLITTFTHGIKALIDYKMGGKESRQESLFLNSILLPATPILLGALIGSVLPLRPEALMNYMIEHNIQGWSAHLVFAGYGMAVGQFSTYVWDRYSSLITGVKLRVANAEIAAVHAAAHAADNTPTPPMGTPATTAGSPSVPVAPVVPVAPADTAHAQPGDPVLPPKPPGT